MVWVLIFMVIWCIFGTIWFVKESSEFDAFVKGSMPVWYKVFYTALFIFISGPVIIFALLALIIIISVSLFLQSF